MCVVHETSLLHQSQLILPDHKVGTEEQQKEFSNLIPLGFVANPQDFDSALMFLAHNEHSAYMTGTNITVDGGKSWGVTSW